MEDTLNEYCCTLIKMSLQFIPKDPRIQVTILKHLFTQWLGAAGQVTHHCPDSCRIYASLSRNELRPLSVYHIESNKNLKIFHQMILHIAGSNHSTKISGLFSASMRYVYCVI